LSDKAQAYFSQMHDGSYALIKDAEEFYALVHGENFKTGIENAITAANESAKIDTLKRWSESYTQLDTSKVGEGGRTYNISDDDKEQLINQVTGLFRAGLIDEAVGLSWIKSIQNGYVSRSVGSMMNERFQSA
jgi:hypothetical protein